MTATRRASHNFALDRALALSDELSLPVLVLEALRCDYPWASDRLHRFVIDGMRDNADAFAAHDVTYLPYVEPKRGAGRGLLVALASDAAAVVTDDFPCFFLPRMVAAAARTIDCRLEAIDSNGLYPVRATERVFLTARAFRTHLEKELPTHLADAPSARPFSGHAHASGAIVPRAVTKRWSFVVPTSLDALPIDHAVAPVVTRGGTRAARARLAAFVRDGLDRYGEDRNHPDDDGASGLSPYLHFGHLSAHEIYDCVKKSKLPSEKFLDEVITWRELGYNFCAHRDDYDRYESLPEWARTSLDERTRDEREHVYSLADFERARTHDPLWNAAQRQLLTEGRIHNYLRMLWGKKILEWTKTPRDALRIMIELNNKYALDGRNPNSYTGIFWVLGRYDRPWAPRRKIFGVIRFMSSASTMRKLHVKQYLKKYGA